MRLDPTLDAKRQHAPSWRDSPQRWAIWYLKLNGHVYRAYRRLIDDARRANPGIRISSDQVLHVLRWDAKVHAKDDAFAINDHASSLFARLYVEEHPDAADNFGSRRSIWDGLMPSEWQRILDAFEPLRKGRRS